MLSLQEDFIQVLNKQVQPALGCTEPVAIALACAKASSLLQGKIKYIQVETSKGVFKNAHGVGIPNTGETGIFIAAALGALVANPELGLQVLEAVADEDVKEAHKLVAANKVETRYTGDFEGVYVKATVKKTEGQGIACISGMHDHFSYVEKNGQVLYTEEFMSNEPTESFSMKNIKVADIITTVSNMDFSSLSFLLKGVEMNKNIAREGLKGKYGLSIGYGYGLLQEQGVLGRDIVDEVKMLVTAASDARMGGSSLPVMTSCGSGNQGIIITLSIAKVAEKLGKTEEETAKALAISHLVNAYVKEHLGVLAPICGASVSAGLGTTASITWLLGGNIERITGAMQGVAANLTGILCDGAKSTCSFKLATSAGEAIISAYLAMEDIYIHKVQGIIGETIEDTIRNFSLISKDGMGKADETILDIMLKNAQ
ncbi:MAG: serine dehydratase subunit alpha family protein [Zhaonellaceae bacterium]|jgi:L-cysteine desulfidase|nr:serine dehydratase subunit alpha family protein [Clostridia bacterium]